MRIISEVARRLKMNFLVIHEHLEGTVTTKRINTLMAATPSIRHAENNEVSQVTNYSLGVGAGIHWNNNSLGSLGVLYLIMNLPIPNSVLWGTAEGKESCEYIYTSRSAV